MSYYSTSSTESYSIMQDQIRPGQRATGTYITLWITVHMWVSMLALKCVCTVVLGGICTSHIYLYFDIFYFYFTTFLKKIMYLLLHTFSLILKSTRFRMLFRTGKWSNSQTYQENIPCHPYCYWSGELTKHKCFICKWCLSVGVCPWLSVNK
jgi:hypothetical protein